MFAEILKVIIVVAGPVIIDAIFGKKK